MSLLDDIICPISHAKIDSYVGRLTATFCATLLALYVLTGLSFIVLFVALDYGLRATGNARYSPLRWLAAQVIGMTNLSPKLIDAAPKLFASRVGFLFAATSALLIPVSLPASMIVAATLLVFAFLDGVFNFCVGCLTYHYMVLPFFQWRGIR